ncbi:Eukaryotic translation initiation factor 3 subunit I [Cichlidogyrus casuarinus]|uniref:Eukaryotic translation initiation factor 3 subunit I n=1 Tax=Cichlidogyrus casuarinus TaxID=1844966 RepID=A0ABD2QKD1_9PLAT
MIPTILQGHERPITQIKYNRDGDLLFTAAKNEIPCVWFAINGERLGSYEGHTGAIWRIDVDHDSTKFLSASTDCSVKLWDVCTGKQLESIADDTPLRSCGFSYCGNLFFFVSDNVMGRCCQLFVVDTRVAQHILVPHQNAAIYRSSVNYKNHRVGQMKGEEHVMKMACNESTKITNAVWGPLDKTIICGYDTGRLVLVDPSSGKEILSKNPHKDIITDIQMYHDQTMFITGSKDYTAKLFDSYDLECHGTYTNERPVNSASISPTQHHILLGGGQEAKDVTTTAVSSGKFDAKLYHMIYEIEFGKIKGHFGPVNSVQFNSDGTGFATGGEDGLVRVHSFDEQYYELENRLF